MRFKFIKLGLKIVIVLAGIFICVDQMGLVRLNNKQKGTVIKFKDWYGIWTDIFKPEASGIQFNSIQFSTRMRSTEVTKASVEKTTVVQDVNLPNRNGSRAGERQPLTVTEKRNKVREMMKHAWHSYVKYAWGYNELNPVSKTGLNGLFRGHPLGATIVDAIDTLYIMGLHDDYQKARNWIAEHFYFPKRGRFVVFEVNIRLVGGLLSAYALTGDKVFMKKATQIVDTLMPVFNTSSGIPCRRSNACANNKSSHAVLAEAGSLHLEFYYLSAITKNSSYVDCVKRLRSELKRMAQPENIYYNSIDIAEGCWAESEVNIGAGGDSFYEYLLKAYLLSDREDMEAKEMYNAAIKALMRKLLKTSASGFKYFAFSFNGELGHKMGHLACFSGGMLALGARESDNETHYLQLGAEIARTCRESYVRSATGLGPEVFGFENGSEAMSGRSNSKECRLRPEVVETYFYMWRITKDPKYRDWAYDVVQALEKHCRREGGYSGVRDVYNKNPKPDGVQQTFFLAETLKYLYLIFSDDTLLSLDKWVFNTEAHPLPIKNVNPAAG